MQGVGSAHILAIQVKSRDDEMQIQAISLVESMETSLPYLSHPRKKLVPFAKQHYSNQFPRLPLLCWLIFQIWLSEYTSI